MLVDKFSAISVGQIVQLQLSLASEYDPVSLGEGKKQGLPVERKNKLLFFITQTELKSDRDWRSAPSRLLSLNLFSHSKQEAATAAAAEEADEVRLSSFSIQSLPNSLPYSSRFK